VPAGRAPVVGQTGVINRLRLASGLVLLAFLTGHLLNHALGLISVEAMGQALFLSIAPWRTRIGTTLLLGALLVHVAVALRALYLRRTLRMPFWEAMQLGLGLLIPLMLAEHVLGTRVVTDLFDVRSEYVLVLTALAVRAPGQGLLQAGLVVIAWGHACIGLHYWLRLKRWYRRSLPVAYGIALLLPALSLAGFLAAAMEVRRRAAADPGFAETVLERARVTAESSAFVDTGTFWIETGFAAAVAAVLLAREARKAFLRQGGRPTLTYPGGRTVEVPPGASVLDVSRANGIPHAAVCGGRGRCSTCRIRVGEGAENLPPPQAEERRVLARIGAPANVRLACQVHPTADLEVTPLLPARATARDASGAPGYLQGEEREIAILFADLRGFTTLVDTKLPFDVVFILNRYFEAMGHAIERVGGRLDKFIGDGVMAVFGVERGAAEGCRRALAAAATMAEELEILNRTLVHDLPLPLRIGIGIHAGPVIVGEMGYGRAKSLTAVGDAVNIASRLEELTKTYGVQLVISDHVAQLAGLDVSTLDARETALRGKTGRIRHYPIASALDLRSR